MPLRGEVYLLRLWNIFTDITGIDGKGGALITPIGGIGITSYGITITQTPTITKIRYRKGYNVGGLLTFANAARIIGGGGIIKDMLIIDAAGQDAKLELWIFDQAFTPGADNTFWAPVDTDLHNLITIITTEDGAYFSGSTPSACPIEVARRYDCIGTDLFGRLVTRGMPTYAATDDLTVRIMLLQD